MKKNIFFLFAAISTLVAILIPSSIIASGNEMVKVELFYSQTCPHCSKAKTFLEKYQKSNPELLVDYIDVSSSIDAAQRFANACEKYDNYHGSVPFVIINGESIIGYGSDETTGQRYIELIGLEATVAGDSIFLPLIGELNPQSLSLPILTVVIAFFDGFNPCAMWVLLFLISLLLGMEDKKKMWILGLTFILTSGLIYFCFMAAWLKVYEFIGIQIWLTKVIGVVAILSGLLNLRKFWNEREGCSTVEGEKRKEVFTKLKDITSSRRFILAMVGIILLAISINLVELVCSAGLPAIYTGVLTVSNLPSTSYYLYLLLYVLIFVLDDLMVFVIAMLTLRATGISTKYGKISNLVGGAIILTLGIILIVKPELLTFA